ncbi:response regulator transcription factor [Kineococcus sp. GCM10028916]|uniref:helix-turn-helix transcriptional regulator n=1 Tax=Kineococcus sp. GCM10028916 TaxID=3273394 RepID=UPI0036326F4C
MLTATRWRLVHDLGMALLEEPDPGTQLLVGLQSLLRLVPGDVAADVDLGPANTSRITEIPELLRPSVPAHARAILESNPALVHLITHGDLRASRVEDLCSPETWAKNPMRRHLLEPNRVPYALLTAHVTENGRTHGWGVNRSRPFDDDDVEVLAAFEGFLRRAAHDRDRSSLVLDLDQAVSGGAGLVLARGGVVTHLNEVAAELLDRHQVPVSTLVGLSRSTLSPTRAVGTLPTRHGALRLRWRPALPGSSAVVVDEAGTAHDGTALTTRQHAILCHLSGGLTAAAMGRQMGISERTVHKHLENLYRALSVTDRLQAVLRGHELGLLPVLGGCGRLDGTVPIGA